MKVLLLIIILSLAHFGATAQNVATAHKKLPTKANYAKTLQVLDSYERLSSAYKLTTDLNDNAVSNLCTLLTLSPICDLLYATSLNDNEDYEIERIKSKAELEKFLVDNGIDPVQFQDKLRKEMLNGNIKHILDSWSKKPENNPGGTIKPSSKNRIIIVE